MKLTEAQFNKSYNRIVETSEYKLPTMDGTVAAQVYETMVAVWAKSGKAKSYQGIMDTIDKIPDHSTVGKKWFVETAAAATDAKEFEDYQKRLVELTNEIGAPIVTNDEINEYLGNHKNWGIVHQSIGEYYTATAEYTDELSAKENTADMVFFKKVKGRASSVEGFLSTVRNDPGLDQYERDGKTTGLIETSDGAYRFAQVSLKKGEGAARVGKVTEQFNEWVLLWTGGDRPNIPSKVATGTSINKGDLPGDLTESINEALPTAPKDFLKWFAGKAKKGAEALIQGASQAWDWFRQRLSEITKDVLSWGNQGAEAAVDGPLPSQSESILQQLGVTNLQLPDSLNESAAILFEAPQKPAEVSPGPFLRDLDALEILIKKKTPERAFAALAKNLRKVSKIAPGLVGYNPATVSLAGVDYQNFLGSIAHVRKQIINGQKDPKMQAPKGKIKVTRDDAHNNFIIDCIKVNSNIIGFQSFNTIVEKMLEDPEPKAVTVAAQKLATALSVEAKFGKTTLPLFIAYGGIDGGIEYLGTRSEKEKEFAKKARAAMATKSNPIMTFEVFVSGDVAAKFFSKSEMETDIAKRNKSNPKANISKDDYKKVKGSKYVRKDRLKYADSSQAKGGRGVSYVVQYLNILVPTSKPTEKPEYKKIQCINRSGSTFSFKMDMM